MKYLDKNISLMFVSFLFLSLGVGGGSRILINKRALFSKSRTKCLANYPLKSNWAKNNGPI